MRAALPSIVYGCCEISVSITPKNYNGDSHMHVYPLDCRTGELGTPINPIAESTPTWNPTYHTFKTCNVDMP